MRPSAMLFLRALGAASMAASAMACGGSDGGTPPPPLPGTPGNVRIVTAADQAVTVAWDPATNATGYNLYLASQAGVTKANYTGKPDGQRRTGVTSPVTVTGLVNGRAYFFVVTSTGAGGESGESAEVSATPVPPAPAAPSNARIIAAGDQAVTVAWDAVAVRIEL